MTAVRLARHSKSAKIVAVDRRTSLLNQMHQSLEGKSVNVEPVLLKGSELTPWLKDHHDADIFGFDLRQCLKVGDRQTLELFSGFVFNKVVEKRLCVVDKKGLSLFEQHLEGANEDVTNKINKISYDLLTLRSRSLE